MKQFSLFLKKELIEFSRDKRNIIFTVLIPFVLGIGSLYAIKYATEPKVDQSQSIKYSYEGDAEFLTLLSNSKWQQAQSSDWKKQILTGKLNVALATSQTFYQDILNFKSPELIVYHNVLNFTSKNMERAEEHLIKTQDQARFELAQKLSLTEAHAKSIQQPFQVETIGIANEREEKGNKIGIMVGLCLILLSVSALIPLALDSGAGEKEKGSAEVIFSTPISLNQFIWGKSTALIIISIMILTLTLSSIKFLQQDLLGLQLSNLELLTSGFLSFLAMCFVAPLFLGISFYAKTYKEAQNFLSWSTLGAVMLAYPLILDQEQSLRSTFWIPGINNIFAIKEVVQGSFDYSYIGAIILTSTLATFIAFLLTKKIIRSLIVT